MFAVMLTILAVMFTIGVFLGALTFTVWMTKSMLKLILLPLVAVFVIVKLSLLLLVVPALIIASTLFAVAIALPIAAGAALLKAATLGAF